MNTSQQNPPQAGMDNVEALKWWLGQLYPAHDRGAELGPGARQMRKILARQAIEALAPPFEHHCQGRIICHCYDTSWF